MKLFRTKAFKKDLYRLKINDQQYEKYIKYVFLLLVEKPLPPEARDHSLIGNYSGFREFHVGGDTLIIYCIKDNILKLTRIGTHAQLYK